MNDDLKRYVDQNRADFELFKPDTEEFWQSITANLDQNKPKIGLLRILAPYYKVAAILIAGMGVLFYWYRVEYPSYPSAQGLELNAMSSEIGETGDYYQGLINEKMEFIQTNSNLIDPIIMEDLDLLDQAFVELKYDLAENVDNEEVVNAMIKNYRIKLKILERILGEIQSKETPDETKANI